MGTEYRRGIPGIAHVEAATRLGLLWEADDRWLHEFRFQNENVEVRYFQVYSPVSNDTGWEAPDTAIRRLNYRPIRPDYTPVDWEVLDQEAARVGQREQPRGFRATLFGTGRAADFLARWTVYQELKPLYDLVDGAQGEAAMPRDVEAEWDRQAGAAEVQTDGDWSLYRNANGFFAQSPDGTTWFAGDRYGAPLRNFAAVLDAVAERRVAERMRGRTQAPTVTSAQPEPVLDEAALRSLILNLPNVASITSRIERGSRQRDRYIVRVQLADPNVPLDRALAAQIPRNVHVHCEGRGDGGQRGVGGTASSIFSPTGNREDAVAPLIQEPQRVNVEPRRFADVRPDRHRWRWWRLFGSDCGALGTLIEANSVHGWRVKDDPDADWHLLGHYISAVDGIRTVIPTDEQGNPVSWESVGQTRFTNTPPPTETQRQALAAQIAEWSGTPEPAGTVQGVNSDGTVTVALNDNDWVSPARNAAIANEVQRVTQAVSRVVQQASQQILGTNVTVSPTGQVEPTNTPDEQSAIPSFSTGRYAIHSGQFSNDFTASAPITAESFARVLQQMDRSAMIAATRFAETPQTRVLVEAQRSREEAETRARIISGDVPAQASPRQEPKRISFSNVHQIPETPLPRFTTDELDDVDHSKTTKLDEVTLRRGKLPTVEQIAKYREVRARRTGGAVADALKESRIDCEVAQYVLERWAGGLGDAQVPWLIATAEGTGRLPDSYARSVIDERVQNELRKRDTLDTSEKPSPTVQRERQEAEDRRQRLARLSEQLRTERAANVETNEAEPNRFDLLEPDPTVDPAESIRAWETRRVTAAAAAAAASRKVGQESRQPAQPTQVEKPPAPKPRPAILVVDAEKDGLTWGEAGLALLGLKLNEAC